MPATTARLIIDRVFTAEEITGLRTRPISTSDWEARWVAEAVNDWIHIHRTWSRLCIYSVRVEPAGDGFRFAEVLVNREPTQYRETDDARDAAILVWLVDRLVMRRDVSLPPSAVHSGRPGSRFGRES